MRFLPFTLLWAAVLPAQATAKLRVCTTTPDLASLAESVGGDQVDVTSFLRGPEDPHFIEARPNMIRELSRADALVEIGLELEIGWLPLLVDNARNSAVLQGAPGRIDASSAVHKLGVPGGTVSRALGDVHAGGNPHYLADPVCGLQVAALLRDRFTALRPAGKASFASGYDQLRATICSRMVGAGLARLYDNEAGRLAQLFADGKLGEFLEKQGDRGKLQGWFGTLLPYRSAKVVADHDLWPYFAARFGIQVIGFFEPKPGIAPTSAHLQDLIERMRAEPVKVILSAPYFAPQHAEFVARATGAHIAEMAHQAGSRPGCDDYVATVDHNVQALAAALKAATW